MSLIRPIDIPEVLYAIFDAAAPRPELVSHRRPRREEILSYARILGRYALVSRLWNECATPALWEMLPDQLPLFKLLPADAWSMIDRETRWTLLENGIEFASNQIFDIKRELKADDWVVLQRLAPHVKALCFAGGACTTSSINMISTALARSHLLLPNLERLYATTLDRDDNEFLPLLCSPAIWDLRVTVLFDSPAKLGDVLRQCPRITHLHLDALFHDFLQDQAGIRDLGIAITSATSVTHLDIDVKHDAAGTLVVLLGHCRSLTHLQLGDSTHVLTKPESALTLRAWHTAIFRSLRSLQLASVCPAFALALLRSLGGAPRAIERLHMPITHFRTRDEMRELIEAVAQHCAPTALVYLNIMAGHLPAINLSQPLDPLLVSIDFFRPLARHRRLEQVFLGESVGGVDLSDDDYSELAQWWPDLVHLRIPNARGNSCTSRTLLAFAKHCKRLESLNLNLDARSPCLPYSEIAEATREPHVLQRLEINGGSVEVAEDMMAELLSALFPGLKEVEHQVNSEWSFAAREVAIAQLSAWRRVSMRLHCTYKNVFWSIFDN